MKLAIGSDHGGVELKETLKQFLTEHYENITLSDLGTHSTESVDYPDTAKIVVDALLTKEADKGILICGTGIGISMAANRHKGIRAAVIYNEFTAEMAKAHNNANIICLGGRTTPPELAKKMVSLWIDSQFEGDRHQRRLDKLDI